MSKLIIGGPATGPAAPEMPEAGDPDVTRWLDRKGTVCALGHTVAGGHWIHVPEVASFRFKVGEDAVTAVVLPNAAMDAVIDRFTRTVWPTVLQVRGYEVLHASAVKTSRGVVAFCAAAETGKSTLAYGLSQRGYSLWADDAVVVDIKDEVRAIPLPFKARLRPASAVYFGHAEEEALVAYRWEGAEEQEHRKEALVVIALLERVAPLPDQPVVTVTPLSPAAAFPRVLAHANFFSLREAACKQRTVRQYLSLVGCTLVVKVSFHTGLEKLPAVLDGIEGHLLSALGEIT